MAVTNFAHAIGTYQDQHGSLNPIGMVSVCNQAIFENIEQYHVYFIDSRAGFNGGIQASTSQPLAQFGQCTNFNAIYGQNVYLIMDTNEGLVHLLQNENILG